MRKEQDTARVGEQGRNAAWSRAGCSRVLSARCRGSRIRPRVPSVDAALWPRKRSAVLHIWGHQEGGHGDGITHSPTDSQDPTHRAPRAPQPRPLSAPICAPLAPSPGTHSPRLPRRWGWAPRGMCREPSSPLRAGAAGRGGATLSPMVQAGAHSTCGWGRSGTGQHPPSSPLCSYLHPKPIASARGVSR